MNTELKLRGAIRVDDDCLTWQQDSWTYSLDREGYSYRWTASYQNSKLIDFGLIPPGAFVSIQALVNAAYFNEY